MSSTALNSDTNKSGIAYIQHGPAISKFGVVFVHGWGCQSTDYTDVLTELAKQSIDYLAIALDLPGHGKTSKDICQIPNMSNFAKILISFCREQDLQTAVLVGHSMGVRVVADAWRECNLFGTPPDIAGLVFLDGSNYKLRPSLFGFDKGDARSEIMSDMEKARQKAAVFNNMFSSLTPESFRTSTLVHIAGMDKSYSDEMRASMIRYDRERMDETMVELGESGLPVCNMQSSDIGPDNQRVPMRAGEKSRWVEYVEERVPGARQIVVEGSAHFPHVDRPNAVAKIVGEFVEEVRMN